MSTSAAPYHLHLGLVGLLPAASSSIRKLLSSGILIPNIHITRHGQTEHPLTPTAGNTRKTRVDPMMMRGTRTTEEVEEEGDAEEVQKRK